nr:peptidoglycan-binding protein LysM [Robertkochia solimangrovi]
MRKSVLKLNFLIAVLILITTVSLGFSSTKKIKDVQLNYSATKPLDYTVALSHQDIVEIHPPFLGKSFNGFKEALAFSESRGNYFVVNNYGYMGKYQFGSSALRALGIQDRTDFLNDPELQEKAFVSILQRNKWILKEYIEQYSGKTIRGVEVTESGILAAAHLAGAGNVKRYLRSGGTVGFKDAFGTSIRYYMKKFAGYDVSHVEANRTAKI